MLILFFVALAYSLQCPSLYDYSSGSVKCVNSCSPDTNQFPNLCCSKTQYPINNKCKACFGWVVNGGLNCCNSNEYWNKEAGRCQTCKTEIFLNGTLCCKGCQYVDMTLSTPSCSPVGSGSCSSLTCTSKQRVCCPAGQIFNAFQNKCVSNTSIRFDQTLRAGCPSNYYLDYRNKALMCVSQCSSGVRIDSIQCSSRYCASSLSQSLSPVSVGTSLLALENNRCCYSLNNGACVPDNKSCTRRYQYNLYPICCPEGQSFNLRLNNCSFTCEDTIVMGLFCLPENSFLDFTTTPPLIASQELNLCNGKPLPAKMNICCPVGYYTSGLAGCLYCSGNIFGTSNYQVCCSKTQTFNQISNQCEDCSGIIDSSGSVCCPQGSYIGYYSNGTSSCVQQCPLQSIQNSIYCCLFCQSSCQTAFPSCSTPTYCSSYYFIPNSCSPCSCGSCTTNLNCISCGANSSVLNSCSKTCQSNKILQNGGCLDCHESCQECTVALDQSKCISCREGYYNNAGTCQKCYYKCRTCEVSSTRCTTCYNTSLSSSLINSTCVSQCQEGSYFSADTCNPCGAQCRACSASNVCLVCSSSYYLVKQGSTARCLPCSASCLECTGAPTTCIYCQSSLSLIPSLSLCSAQCPPSSIKVLINSQLGYVCKPCDPACVTCLPTPIDCTQCKIGYYMNTSLGTSSCFPCQKGCQACTVLQSCSGRCLAGYFQDPLRNSCIQCPLSCLTCNGSSENNCLSCAPNITLSSGRCVGCVPTCLTCTSPNLCTSCISPYVFYSANSTCLPSCPVSTYNLNRTCLNCSQNCLECSTGSNCTRCSINYQYIDAGRCVAVCSPVQVIVGNECRYCNGTVYQSGRACCQLPYRLVNSVCVNQTGDNPVVPPPPSNNVSQREIQQLIRVQKNQIYYTLVPIDPSQANNFTSLQLELIHPILSNQLSLSTYPLSFYSSTSNSITYTTSFPNFTTSGYLARSSFFNQTNFTTLQYSSHLISQSYYQQVGSSSAKYLKILSIIPWAVLFVFGLLSKFKGHYIAEQSNLLIIHSLYFCQAAALFKNLFILPKQLHSFLEGLMASHFYFFWNMFNPLIPPQYIEPNYPSSLNPDGNFLRQAGFSVSFLIILTSVFLICITVSYIFFCCSNVQEPPLIRKILRFFFFLTSICFMNITFCAVTSCRYHISPQLTMNPSLYSSSYGAGIFFLVLIPVLIITFFIHYYLTYVQEQDQYLYTLREGCELLYIYFQGIVLGLSVSKYTTLFLILMEGLWLTFNLCLDLNRDGGFKIRLSVISALIGLSYLLLSFGKNINIGVVVIVTLVILTLIVYCSYHVIGLYYYCLCGNQAEEEEQQEQGDRDVDEYLDKE